ncbi:MAG: DUF998 domain-containing protein [Acidobacteriota bacterium]
MRRVVGVIALALPFALAGGTILLSLLGPNHRLPHPLLQAAISDYLYTPVGTLYVGSLAGIAMFLMSSRGYDRADEVAGYLAGIFAMGVALFPSEDPRVTRYTRLQIRIGYVHSAFAVLMFLSIAYFCLFLFRRTTPGRRITRRKQHRNRIYAACGAVILACTAVMVGLTLFEDDPRLAPYHLFLISESLALFAFGIAWLTKGEGFLRDRPQNHVRAV